VSNNPKHLSTVYPVSTTRVPRVFLSISAISKPDRSINDGAKYCERKLASYSIGIYERVFNTYRCNGEQSEENPKCGYHAYEYILDAATKHDSIWIVCNNVEQTLTLINFWDLMDAGLVTLPGVANKDGIPNLKRNCASGYVAIGGKVQMIVCRYKKCTIRIVGIANYGDTSLEDVFNSQGDTASAAYIKFGEDIDTYPSALEIQRAMGHWYKDFLLRWRNDDCGPWKMTSSQLAHVIYHRKFLKQKKTTARRKELDRLERSAVFGGRAEAYYLGDVCRFSSDIARYISNYIRSPHTLHTEKIYRLDISSMYPYIFSQYEIPGECVYHDECSDLNHIKLAVRTDYIIVAAVRLKTNTPEYPCRIHEHRADKSVVLNEEIVTQKRYVPSSVEYPVGEFDTILVGPELERAVRDNLVIKLYEYAAYKPSDEYMDFFQYVINQRMIAKISKDKPLEKLWKMIGNSFGGKLAQRNRGWTQAPPSTIVNRSWGEWTVHDMDTGITKKYRAIAGYPQIWKEDTYSPKGRPIVWAFVCSIGRYMMRSVREILPAHSVLQQDTDGLYVTADAIPILERYNLIQAGIPGGLRIVSEHKHIRFWGPRHYIVDDDFVMSGLSTGFTYVSKNMYLDKKRSSVTSGKNNEAPTSIPETTRTITLSCGIGEVRIDENGFVMPFSALTQTGWKSYADAPLAGLFRGIGDC